MKNKESRSKAIEKFVKKAKELLSDDKLEYNELVIIIGRQNAESVKTSKGILDRGNKIASDGHKRNN